MDFFQSLGQESCKLVNWHPTLEKGPALYDFVESANDFLLQSKICTTILTILFNLYVRVEVHGIVRMVNFDAVNLLSFKNQNLSFIVCMYGFEKSKIVKFSHKYYQMTLIT